MRQQTSITMQRYYLTYIVLVFISVTLTSKGAAVKLTLSSHGNTKVNFEFRPDVFKTCSYNLQQNMELKNVEILRDDFKNILLNGNFLLHRDLTVASVNIKLIRCLNKTESTCERIQIIPIPKGVICSSLNRKDMPWTGLFRSISPTITCPLMKSASYNLRNGTIHVSNLQNVPLRLEHYYWKPITELYDEKGFYACTEIGGYAYRIRK